MLLSSLDATCIRSKLTSSTSGYPEIVQNILKILSSGSDVFLPVIKCLSVLIERMGSRFWQFFSDKPKMLCETIFSHRIFCESVKEMSCLESDDEKEESYSQLVYRKSLKAEGTDEISGDSVIFCWIVPFVQSLLDFGQHMSSDISIVIRKAYDLLNDTGFSTVLYQEIVAILLSVSNLLYSKKSYNLLLRCQKFWLPALFQSVDSLATKNFTFTSNVIKFFEKLLRSETALCLPDTDSFLSLLQASQHNRSKTKNTGSLESLSAHVCRILKSLSSPKSTDSLVLHDMFKQESKTQLLAQTEFGPSIKIKSEKNTSTSVAEIKDCSVVIKKEDTSASVCCLSLPIKAESEPSLKIGKIKSEQIGKKNKIKQKPALDISPKGLDYKPLVFPSPLPQSSESPSRKKKLSLSKHSKSIRYEESEKKFPIALKLSYSQQERTSPYQPVSPMNEATFQSPSFAKRISQSLSFKRRRLEDKKSEAVKVNDKDSDDGKLKLTEDSSPSGSLSDSDSFLPLITPPEKKEDTTPVKSNIVEKKILGLQSSVKRKLVSSESKTRLASKFTSKSTDENNVLVSAFRKCSTDNLKQELAKVTDQQVYDDDDDDATQLFTELSCEDIDTFSVFDSEESESTELNQIDDMSSDLTLSNKKSPPCDSENEHEFSKSGLFSMKSNQKILPNVVKLADVSKGNVSVRTEDQRSHKKSIISDTYQKITEDVDLETIESSPSSTLSSPRNLAKMHSLSVDIIRCKGPKTKTELTLSRKLNGNKQTEKPVVKKQKIDKIQKVIDSKEQKKISRLVNTGSAGRKRPKSSSDLVENTVSETLPPFESSSKKIKLCPSYKGSIVQPKVSNAFSSSTKKIVSRPVLVEPRGMEYSKKKALLQKQFNSHIDSNSPLGKDQQCLPSTSSSSNFTQKHFQQPFDNKRNTSNAQRKMLEDSRLKRSETPSSISSSAVLSATNKGPANVPFNDNRYKEPPVSFQNTLSSSTRNLIGFVSTPPFETSSLPSPTVRPTEDIQKEIHVPPQTHLLNIYTTPTNLTTMNNLFARILSWDPNVFLYPGQDEKGQRICPPCTEDIFKNLKNVPQTFKSYDEYFGVFGPLFFIELWENVS